MTQSSQRRSTTDRAPGVPTSDVVGATLFATLVVWVLLVGAWTGRDPSPMAALVTACAVTVFVARGITRRKNWLVPALLLTVLVGAILLTWPAAIHRGFGLTGYANANGALYVIGVGAAGLIVLRSRSAKVRIGAGGAGVVLMVLPWLFASNMAAGGAMIVAATTGWLGVARERALPSVTFHSILVVALVLLATGAAGFFYGGGGVGDGGSWLTERRLVLWSESVEMLVSQPLTGVGPGGFADESRTALRDSDARWAHHTPLQMGAETGIPGLLLLLGLIGWAFVWLGRGSGRRGAALASLVLALSTVHASVDFVWHYPVVPIALAGLVGAGASAGNKPRDEHLDGTP